jgi:hypothetical protein
MQFIITKSDITKASRKEKCQLMRLIIQGKAVYKDYKQMEV